MDTKQTVALEKARNTDSKIYLNVSVRGQWIYHFSPTDLRQIAAQIAGKSVMDARAWLLRQPEIASVQFYHDGAGNVPGAENIFTITEQ